MAVVEENHAYREVEQALRELRTRPVEEQPEVEFMAIDQSDVQHTREEHSTVSRPLHPMQRAQEGLPRLAHTEGNYNAPTNIVCPVPLRPVSIRAIEGNTPVMEEPPLVFPSQQDGCPKGNAMLETEQETAVCSNFLAPLCFNANIFADDAFSDYRSERYTSGSTIANASPCDNSPPSDYVQTTTYLLWDSHFAMGPGLHVSTLLGDEDFSNSDAEDETYMDLDD